MSRLGSLCREDTRSCLDRTPQTYLVASFNGEGILLLKCTLLGPLRAYFLLGLGEIDSGWQVRHIVAGALWCRSVGVWFSCWPRLDFKPSSICRDSRQTGALLAPDATILARLLPFLSLSTGRGRGRGLLFVGCEVYTWRGKGKGPPPLWGFVRVLGRKKGRRAKSGLLLFVKRCSGY